MTTSKIVTNAGAGVGATLLMLGSAQSGQSGLPIIGVPRPSAADVRTFNASETGPLVHALQASGGANDLSGLTVFSLGDVTSVQQTSSAAEAPSGLLVRDLAHRVNALREAIVGGGLSTTTASGTGDTVLDLPGIAAGCLARIGAEAAFLDEDSDERTLYVVAREHSDIDRLAMHQLEDQLSEVYGEIALRVRAHQGRDASSLFPGLRRIL